MREEKQSTDVISFEEEQIYEEFGLGGNHLRYLELFNSKVRFT